MALSERDKFKIYLIQHDLLSDYAMETVDLCPKLIEQFNYNELPFILSYLIPKVKPEQYTPKFSPIVYDAVRLKAMRSSKSIIDTLNAIIAKDPECSQIIEQELLHLATYYKAKLENSL